MKYFCRQCQGACAISAVASTAEAHVPRLPSRGLGGVSREKTTVKLRLCAAWNKKLPRRKIRRLAASKRKRSLLTFEVKHSLMATKLTNREALSLTMDHEQTETLSKRRRVFIMRPLCSHCKADAFEENCKHCCFLGGEPMNQP